MSQQTADSVASSGPQTPCRECGEMVRTGLVRCWNCGAFVDPAVEKRFHEMQKNPPPPILSDPDEAASAADSATFGLADDGSAGGDSGAAEGGDEGGDEGGFQLGGSGAGVTFDAGMPDDFGVEAEETAPAARPPQPVAGVDVPSQAEDDDDLLSVAMNDLEATRQKEQHRIREGFAGGVRTAGGFIIFCPYGCKIEVKDKHRGQVGKCPKCQAPFVVPVDPPKYKKKAAAAKPAADLSGAIGPYVLWQTDRHLHVVDPEKLKIKADSLVKDFTLRDLALSADHLALIPMAGKSGMFGSGGGKTDEIRSGVQSAAAGSKSGVPDKVDAGEVLKIKRDLLTNLRVIQPAKRGQSIFAGTPVFGTGRIAVQLPDTSDGTNPAAEKPHYLSFELTDFREFSKALEDVFGIGSFGEDDGVPLKDDTFDYTCHYTDAPIKALKALEFYKADPKLELVLAGWQCGECGLTLSEDARKKENLGGKAGKGMAKTKCPKCEQKMGDHPLYTLPTLVEGPAMQSDS